MATDSTVETIQFTAPVRSVGGHPIVRFPPDASRQLPSRGQVAMAGSIDGEAIETVVEPDGRRGHWLRLTEGHEVGSEVAVELSPTKQWPEPEVPEDLRAALDDAPDLDELWESITPMARWEWVRWVRATRNADTRARRVEVGIDKMRSGKRRPCCFDLASCTDPDVARGGKLPVDDD